MDYCFVDGSQLDTALTATASAIRSKTGGTENIAFLPATGFAEAISEIQNGIELEGFHVNNLFPYISSYTTDNVSYLTIISMKYVDYSYSNGFHSLYKNYIGEVYFSHCQLVSTGNFYSCTKLTKVWMPECVTIGSSAFYGCTSLSDVRLPECQTLGNSAFGKCTGLTTVSFPACKTISLYAFQSCYSLMSAYFMGSSYVNLSTEGAFYSTPMSRSTYTGTFGSIYVPASMLATYKTRTNWTTYSNRLVGI